MSKDESTLLNIYIDMENAEIAILWARVKDLPEGHSSRSHHMSLIDDSLDYILELKRQIAYSKQIELIS